MRAYALAHPDDPSAQMDAQIDAHVAWKRTVARARSGNLAAMEQVRRAFLREHNLDLVRD